MKRDISLDFEKPSFWKRLKGMLGVDFYRLLHTPLFYIFLVIAAIIPAMILGTSGMENPQTGESSPILYENTWHIVASVTPTYVVKSIAEYANMNMVFIFGGIMVSIFIGRDYQSGYVKQLFTTHPKKEDYVISKTLACAFAMACMCVTYLLGAVAAGLLTKTSFAGNVGSIVCALLGKMLMSLGWASLYVLLNVVFRRYFGISIASSFFFGTGILIIGAAAIVGETSALNVFLYGASVYACLSADFGTVLVCLLVSCVWAVVYNAIGALVLYRSDVY